MKKTLVVTLVLLLAVGIPGIAKSDCAEEIIWQIGIKDGEIDPQYGAAEYPAYYANHGIFLYDLDSDENPKEAPQMPGYLGFYNVCEIFRDDRPCTDTTADLIIDFSLDRDYNAEELILFYGRYGRGQDELAIPAFPEDLHVIVGGTGEGFQEFKIPLPELLAGKHILDIAYHEGVSDIGHYIDYLKLVVTPDNCNKTVAVDIKPQSCPNPLNVKSKGVLPVALLGTGDFDVSKVDIESLRLEGVSPLRLGFEDVATPYTPASEKEDCFYDCDELGPDGFLDLTLKFDTQEVVAAINAKEIIDGDCLILHLTGNLLNDTTLIEGQDVVLILDKPNSQGKQEKKGKK